jgi:small conductance mechanosensitive channel
MFIRFLRPFLFAAVFIAMRPDILIAQIPDSTVSPPDEFSGLLTNLRELAQGRDSLAAQLERDSTASHEFLEELILERNRALHAGLLALVDKIEEAEGKGRDITEIRRILNNGLKVQWPRYRDEMRKRGQELGALSRSSDAASSAERLEIESELNKHSDRLLELYESVLNSLFALERVGVDISEPRAYLAQRLPMSAKAMVTRVQLAKQEHDNAASRLSRDASNAELRHAYDASEERLKRATRILSSAIKLMDRLNLENTDLRVALISTTGRVTSDVFKWKVLLGLLKTVWTGFVELLSVKAPQWLFQGLLIVLSLLGFRALAKIVRKGVRRAVRHSKLTELMRSTIVRLAVNAVWLIGFFVILTQLGVQVAPLLAGLGIAGIAIGFAMQNTLSNFAAGGMILGNQPFDVGDEIEVAGVVGTVKKMSLVSTTILTADNQTLIIPNSTVWGGVIRNRTAQPTRRVDLTFGIGYRDNLEKTESVLREVVEANENVIRNPPPVIKVDRLADSTVNFVVRVWTTKEQYWDVYWDLTRAVKLRLDQEGIIPQREVRLTVDKGGSESLFMAR